MPSGMAALVVSSAPLWMLILEALRPGGRKPPSRALVGVALGFAGVMLLLWPSGGGGLLQVDPLGAGALIFAALAWSFGSIYIRYATLPSSPLMGSAVEMLIGGAALFLLGTLTGELAQAQFETIALRSWLGLAYLIIFGSLIGFTAYTWLLRVAPTSLVATYAYVNPLVALIIGTLIGNEAFSPRTLAAAAVILGSVALTTTAHRSTPAEAQPAFTSDD